MRYTDRASSMGNVFLYLYLCFFPLFVWTNYSNITNMKMVCFLVLLVGFGITVYSSRIMKKATQLTIPWKAYIPDLILGGFLFSGLISGLTSPYLGLENKDGLNLVFFGAGRHDGWLFLLAYAFLFFLASRYGNFKREHLQAFAIVIFVMCFIGVVQLSGVNFLSLYPKNVYQGNPNRFFSTIGNADIMGGFLCMAVPIVGVGYVVFRLNKPMRAFFLVTHTIAVYLMLCLEVDMAIVGLAALVVVMAPLLMRNKTYMKRLLDVGMSLALGCAFTGFVQYNYVKEEMATYTFIKAEPLFIIGMVALMVMLCARLLVEFVQWNRFSYKALRWVVFGLEIAGIIGVFCLFRFVVEEPAKRGLVKDLYELVRGQLSLTAGNHRIGIWKYSFMMGKRNPIFGTGTGTFAKTFKEFAVEAGYSRYANRNLDFAHNEYLHYFCTMGIMGALAYLAFLGSVAVQAVKRCVKNPKILVLGAAVLGYSVQVFFCFSVVIDAPFFWLFLGLLVGEIRATITAETIPSARLDMLEMDSAE